MLGLESCGLLLPYAVLLLTMDTASLAMRGNESLTYLSEHGSREVGLDVLEPR